MTDVEKVSEGFRRIWKNSRIQRHVDGCRRFQKDSKGFGRIQKDFRRI